MDNFVIFALPINILGRHDNYYHLNNLVNNTIWMRAVVYEKALILIMNGQWNDVNRKLQSAKVNKSNGKL